MLIIYVSCVYLWFLDFYDGMYLKSDRHFSIKGLRLPRQMTDVPSLSEIM